MFNSFYVYKTPGTIENMKIYDLIFQKSWKWSIYLILNNIQASEASQNCLLKDFLFQQFVVCIFGLTGVVVWICWLWADASHSVSQSDHWYRYPANLIGCNCKYQNVISDLKFVKLPLHTGFSCSVRGVQALIKARKRSSIGSFFACLNSPMLSSWNPK